jgi:hypothetical protein
LTDLAAREGEFQGMHRRRLRQIARAVEEILVKGYHSRCSR